MKTFEERYTAWIDGKLEGPALTSFDLELSRRASAGEARADKEDAARLHQLLTIHLKAPPLTNADFFSHQLRERIEAERSSERRRENLRQTRSSIFSWPFIRLAGLGAACLFVAAALYYGTMPPRASAPSPDVAVNHPVTLPDPANGVPTPTTPEPVAPGQTTHSADDAQFALASPTPPSVDLNDNIQEVRVAPSSNRTSATPLELKDRNVSVLWINGLDYMQSVPGASPAGTVPAPANNVAP